MRQDGGNLLMEEVQDPVMNAARCCPKPVDPVTQEVRFWPAQFVAQFPQPFDPDEALSLAWVGSSRNQLTNGTEPSSSR